MTDNPLLSLVKSQINELDKSLGYLTDQHIKWFKFYCYSKFGNKNPYIEITLVSKHRKLRIVPYGKDGKIINVNDWLRIRNEFLDKDEKDMPVFLDLKEWDIKFTRTHKRSKRHDNKPSE